MSVGELIIPVMSNDPLTSVQIGTLVVKRYGNQLSREEINKVMGELVTERKVELLDTAVRMWKVVTKVEVSSPSYKDFPIIFVDLSNCNTEIDKLEKMAQEGQIKLYKFVDPCYHGPGVISHGPMDFVYQVPDVSKGFKDSADVELIMYLTTMINKGEILPSTTLIILSKDKIMDYLGEKLRRDKLADVHVFNSLSPEVYSLL